MLDAHPLNQLALQADREEMLAFLRDDLPPDAELRLRIRLAAEPALREELSWLREAMEATDAEDVSTATRSTPHDAMSLDAMSMIGTDSSLDPRGADALPFAGGLLAPAAELGEVASARYDNHYDRHSDDDPRFLPSPVIVADVQSPSKRASLGFWLDRQAWVVLPVLLVLLLAQAGAIAWLAAQRNQLAATLQANTQAAIRAQPSPCLSVWVAPLDTTSVASLKEWMTLYGGKFVEGPDVEGHIRIAFHDEMDLAAAMHDPATIKIAHRIDQPAGCTG